MPLKYISPGIMQLKHGIINMKTLFFLLFSVSLFAQMSRITSVSNLAALYYADTLNQADASDVSTWSDISGNGKDVVTVAAPSTPTYQTAEIGTKDVVRFDGGDFLRITEGLVANATDDVTVIALVKTTSANAQQRAFSMVSTVTTNIQFFWRFSSNGSSETFGRGNNAGEAQTATDGEIDDSQFHKIVARWNATAGLVEANADGGAFATAAKGSAFTSGAFTMTEIGGHGLGTAQFLTGDIAILAVYNRALSDAEVLQVENAIDCIFYGTNCPETDTDTESSHKSILKAKKIKHLKSF